MRESVAVVTGGSGALGGAVVGVLLREGWRVHVPVRSSSAAAALRERHGGDPHLHAGEAELTDPEAVAAFFARVGREAGRLDLLANLVGGFAAGDVVGTAPDTWDRMWRSNATAPFLAIRSAVPLLRASGGGSIVNVVAAAAVGGPRPGMSAYLAAKSALVSLTRNLAEELAPDRITVNAVAPSVIDTPANRSAMPRVDTASWLAAQDIAEVIRFLADPKARVVTGSVLLLRKD